MTGPCDKHSATRRIFLRSSLVSGAAASQFDGLTGWTKPVVQTVILPAHAVTSVPDPVPEPPRPSGSVLFATSDTFTVPQNVVTIQITAIGAAGGGGGGGNAGMFDLGGAGGAGSVGLSVSQSFSVNPGDTLTITIGTGGIGGLPYSATRRANGGFAGGPGGDTSVSGSGVSILASGGRGGGGGGGAIGGVTLGNPMGSWMGDPGQDGHLGGAGGLGFNRTNNDPSRDGETATGGALGSAAAGNGGSGAVGTMSNFASGGPGGDGGGGTVSISW